MNIYKFMFQKLVPNILKKYAFQKLIIFFLVKVSEINSWKWKFVFKKLISRKLTNCKKIIIEQVSSGGVEVATSPLNSWA